MRVKMDETKKSTGCSVELRKKLRAKIGERQIQRSTKHCREMVLDQTMKSMGLDRQKLKDDLAAIKQQGGLTISLKKDS